MITRHGYLPHKCFAQLALVAAFLGGCVTMPPPANRSAFDPSDASAPEASARTFRPNLVATTQVYLNPSVGRGAQKMDHSKMQGIGGMEGMDHSKMQGMDKQQSNQQSNAPGMEGIDHSKMPGMQSSQPAPQPSEQGQQEMQGMDHSKMPGMTQSPAGTTPPQPAGMPGMDHSKMQGMAPPPQGAVASPPSKEVLETEMQKTSDEMKKLSDELKAKTDAARAAEQSGGKPGVPERAPQATIYTCPMHPEVKQPAPGSCPKCGMTLVKKEG